MEKKAKMHALYGMEIDQINAIKRHDTCHVSRVMLCNVPTAIVARKNDHLHFIILYLIFPFFCN